jgi:hypothetical protein
MKIEYISHACLSINTDELHIVTDPWFAGAAYCGQWHLFPKPVDTTKLLNADTILYSHGHEDHLHEPTLRMFSKRAEVFYPHNWYAGVRPFFHTMGFEKVTEALNAKTYRLSTNTSVTYIANNLDSIIVLESDGQVFVNVNDALHSYPTTVIDAYVRLLKARWPRIDVLFCGFGGASYFPNALHCPGKNDLEIGEAREQQFVQAFCKIVYSLEPVVAVPFAADFVLLNEKQRWINTLRFPRTRIPNYFRELYSGQSSPTRIVPMSPGDMLDGNELLSNSPYRAQMKDGSLHHLIDEQYPRESCESRLPPIAENEAALIAHEIATNIRSRTELFSPSILDQVKFTIKLSDVADYCYYNVRIERKQPVIKRSRTADAESILQIETSAQLLRYSFASDWGGDALTIGYGCDIQIAKPETIESSLDVVCMQLLTRIPVASRYWKAEPLRMARHVLGSPISRRQTKTAILKRLLPRAPETPKDVMRQWLFRSKCEVCRACDLPMLNEISATQL